MDEFKLKYDSGNVISNDVHKIGIIALGSYLENHGAALPIDTDSKIAANVALNVATKTGAVYLGIFYGATEYDYVKHGIHLSCDDLINNEIIPQLKHIKNSLNLEYVIIVNGHGGNNLIMDSIDRISENIGMNVIFNNSIIENEGPHATTGELSMGAALGIIDIERLKEHENYTLHPEVAMIGLTDARENNEIINQEAETIKKEGFSVDVEYGHKLLSDAQDAIIAQIKQLLKIKD